MLAICEWLANTPWSIALHESLWGYPIIESIHVLTLCVFVGLAAMMDLRLLGWIMKETPVTEVTSRLLPWISGGFAVMVVTGALLFYGIPVRSYQNIFFRIKAVLLILAGLNVLVFHRGIYRRVAEWEKDGRPPGATRLAGGLSLMFWAAVIVAGRMIAYNWFDKPV